MSTLTAAVFPGWSSPQVRPILGLHRGPDSFIRFLRRDGEKGLVPLRSIQARDLEGMFPEFVECLIQDAFFTVNSFFRPATHLTENSRYLNACYVDLDHREIRIGAALALIEELQVRGVVPRASIVARSGNGCWAFWLLRDEENPELPTRAFTEKKIAYLAIQRALYDGIRAAAPKLGVDGNALDISRVTRVPGSLHSGADRHVSYYLQVDPGESASPSYRQQKVLAEGPTYSYTLPELQKLLKVDRRPSPRMTRARSTGAVPNRRAGWRAVAQGRLDEFFRLERHRGGFSDGYRNRACYVLGFLLRSVGAGEGYIQGEVLRLAGRCNPPYPPLEALRAVKDRISARRVTDQTLRTWLAVTENETLVLDLHHLRHDAGYVAPPSKGRKERRERRYAALASVKECWPEGTLPTTRGVAKILLSEFGIRASVPTVWKDARRVGFSFERPGPDQRKTGKGSE